MANEYKLPYTVSEIEKKLGEVIDQTYSPTSENAQSGIAVAQAIVEATGDIETTLDSIIAIQNSLIGGDSI